VAAFDHLSPDQFDPTNFQGWDMGPHRFSRVSKGGKVTRNTPMEANSLGKVEARDRMDDGDLDSMTASKYPFGDRPSLYGFAPHTTHRFPN
jgi:hypothetical protein